MNLDVLLRGLLPLMVAFSACRETPPAADLRNYVVTPGFQVELVASEPLIQAPVCLQFDAAGRLWVLEMPGYMPNLDGTNEETSNGRILILEDKNHDGQMDAVAVFLDSLVLPRAMALVYGGVLYAEPPRLWFVEIDRNDRPGRKTLVDSAYATGGNVEHQPNGLLLNLDNWIYSAKSAARYRRDARGIWHKEKTAFRGQWGISHDDWGRLYYNDNSNQLYGDYFLPNTADINPFFSGSHAVSQTIVSDQRVYPLKATAVNRGYMEGVLDSTGRLKQFTAACSPWVYRGHLFPEEYRGNVFVCGPEANLIKRNILETSTVRTSGRQAWQDREFLAAPDEAFRPVAFCEAPDGALYVADMHRGIIQHRSYLTAYLREQLQQRGLDTVVGMGRILRIVPENCRPAPPFSLANATDEMLVQYLEHPNGWIRDKAQQLLVEHRRPATAALLRQTVRVSGSPLARIHALWALEGMEMLQTNDIKIALQHGDPRVIATGFRLLSTQNIDAEILTELNFYLGKTYPVQVEYYRAFCLGALSAGHETRIFPLLYTLLDNYPTDTLMAEMVLAGLNNREISFEGFVLQQKRPFPYLTEIIAEVSHKRVQAAEVRAKPAAPRGDFMTRGLRLYTSLCSGCHGADGYGIEHLAPPLLHAEHVSECSEKVASIVLHGLKGPVHIRGKRYEFASPMPAFKHNEALSDADLAALVSFVRNAFSEKPSGIQAETVARLRKKAPRGDAFLESELGCF